MTLSHMIDGTITRVGGAVLTGFLVVGLAGCEQAAEEESVPATEVEEAATVEAAEIEPAEAADDDATVEAVEIEPAEAADDAATVEAAEIAPAEAADDAAPVEAVEIEPAEAVDDAEGEAADAGDAPAEDG